jgi:hypothetical protein
VNCAAGVFGPGYRANATIGRVGGAMGSRPATRRIAPS